jgi:hypothetical protein
MAFWHLALLLVAGWAHVVSAVVCLPGQYPDSLDLTCLNCPSGTYSYVFNASSIDVCTPCPAGRYAPSVGLTSCLTCNAGTFLPAIGSNSSSDCIPCGVGTYGVSVGAASADTCISCPLGTYGSTEGIGQCTFCPAGTYNDAIGATSLSNCTLCPLGTASVSIGAMTASTCVLCDAGRYADSSGSSACTLCEFGTYNDVRGSTSNASCIECSSGTYNPWAGGTCPTSCKSCASGTSSLPGWDTCVETCSAAPNITLFNITDMSVMIIVNASDACNTTLTGYFYNVTQGGVPVYTGYDDPWPTVTVSGLLALTVYTVCVSYVTLLGAGLSTCVDFTTSPSILSGSFGSGGDILFLSGPSSILGARRRLAASPSVCDLSTMLDASSLAKMGSGATCTWISSTELTVYLGSGATVVPGDLLALESSMQSYGQMYMLVREPAQGFLGMHGDVVSSVDDGASIAYCSSWSVSVKGSSGPGAGTHGFSSVWTLAAAPSTEIPASVKTELEKGSSEGSVTLTDLSWAVGLTLTLMVTLRTPLTTSLQSTVQRTIAVVADALPTLSLGAGSSFDSWPVNKPLSLQAVATPASCASSTWSPKMSWTMMDAAGNVVSSWLTTARNTLSTYLPAGLTTPGDKYTIKADLNGYNVMSCVSWTATGSPPVAVIQGGETVSVSRKQSRVLDASGSRNMDPTGSLLYTWSFSNGIADIVTDEEVTILPKESMDLYASDVTVTLKVTSSTTGLSSVAYQNWILTFAETKSAVSMSALAKTVPANANVLYVEAANAARLCLTDSMSGLDLAESTTGSLVVSASELNLVAGRSYTWSAENEEGEIQSASTMTMNIPPSGGRIVVTQETTDVLGTSDGTWVGAAVLGHFSVCTYGWTDTDGLITYRARVIGKDGDSAWILGGSEGSFDKCRRHVSLPWQLASIEVVAEDALGAKSVISTSKIHPWFDTEVAVDKWVVDVSIALEMGLLEESHARYALAATLPYVKHELVGELIAGLEEVVERAVSDAKEDPILLVEELYALSKVSRSDKRKLSVLLKSVWDRVLVEAGGRVTATTCNHASSAVLACTCHKEEAASMVSLLSQIYGTGCGHALTAVGMASGVNNVTVSRIPLSKSSSARSMSEFAQLMVSSESASSQLFSVSLSDLPVSMQDGSVYDYLEARTFATPATSYPWGDAYVVSDNAYTTTMEGVLLPSPSACAEGFEGASSLIGRECVATKTEFEVRDIVSSVDGKEGGISIFIPYVGGDRRARCAWFDTEKLSWSSEGCSVGAVTEEGYTCHCSHLTTFALVSDDAMSLECSKWAPAWRAMGGAPFYSLWVALTFAAWIWLSGSMTAWVRRQWKEMKASQMMVSFGETTMKNVFSNSKYHSVTFTWMVACGGMACLAKALHEIVALSWLSETSSVAIVCSELGFGEGRAIEVIGLLVYPSLISFMTMSSLEWHSMLKALSTARKDVPAAEIEQDRVLAETTRTLVLLGNCVLMPLLVVSLGVLPPVGSGAGNDAMLASGVFALANVLAMLYFTVQLRMKMGLYNVSRRSTLLQERSRDSLVWGLLLALSLLICGASNHADHSTPTLVFRLLMLRGSELGAMVSAYRALQISDMVEERRTLMRKNPMVEAHRVDVEREESKI